jgi:hypothetical protein
MPTPQVVFQILPSLVVGGAERLVVHLVERLSRERFAPVCICLESPLGTHYEARVRALGVPLYFSGQRALGASGGALRQLSALFRQYRPAVAHTHIIGLNYAYPLMLRYRTPARVHTVHSLAQREDGGTGRRVGADSWRFGIVSAGWFLWRWRTRCGRASSSCTATPTRR